MKRAVHAVRLENLRRVASRFGSHAALAQRIGKSKGWHSQLVGINPTTPVSEKIASEVEERLGLAEGVLDQASVSLVAPAFMSPASGLTSEAVLAREIGRLVEDFVLSSPEYREQILLAASRAAGRSAK
jgi:hypothetical protein